MSILVACNNEIITSNDKPCSSHHHRVPNQRALSCSMIDIVYSTRLSMPIVCLLIRACCYWLLVEHMYVSEKVLSQFS